MSYGRSSILVKWDTASDFSTLGTPARSYAKEYSTSAKVSGPIRVSAATTGTSIETGYFSSIQCAVFYNTDSTNYVSLAYTNSAGTSITNLRVPAGEWVKLADIAVSADITVTANTAACTVEVFLFGT